MLRSGYRLTSATTVNITNNGAGGFFRSMNRKIPHALDEHEGNTLGFDEVLIPGAVEQEVDQGADVGDADIAIAIAISGSQVDTSRIAGQQVVDQGRYVGNRHIVVAVHVTAQEGTTLLAEVARVARAAVDVGVGLVLRVGGTVGRSLTAHQAVAYVEHTRG